MKNLYHFRKIHLRDVIMLLFLFGSLTLSAQQIITENTSRNFTGTMKYQPTFDQSNYTKTIDKNGDKIFSKNQSYNLINSESQKTTNNANLTLNFLFDADEFYISSVSIYNESGYTHSWTYNDVTNPVVIAVPLGIYDIITEFKPVLDSGKSHFVVQEQQSVQANTNVQMNPNAAVNYISIAAYDENGAAFVGGSGGYFFFNRSFYFNPSEFVALSNYYFTSPIQGQDPEWNFYINNVSNRYSIVESLTASGYPQGDYFTKFQTISGISQAVSIANDPLKWSYHIQLFQSTIQGVTINSPAYFIASTFNGNLISGWGYSAGGLIDPGNEPFRGFINNPLDSDPADLLVIPAIVDTFVMFSPTTGGISYFTKGSPIFSDGNGGILYGSGEVSYNSHDATALGGFLQITNDYYVTANGKYKFLPYHPRFAFDEDSAPSMVIGNNTPILITGFVLNDPYDNFQISSKGRYGETREADYLATEIEVKQNGNVIFTGAFADFGTLNSPSGNIEMTLTTANTMIEGLAGVNTTTINYNATAADHTPPVLQHLQFRNSDNQVTSILETNEGATVRLAAGDFVYNIIDAQSGYFTYQNGNSLTVAYSIYNQNDWNPLTVTENPAYFQMPAFGDYYEASLSDISYNANDNLWYDLKVICTDAAGNSQQQVISRAFKVNQHSLATESFGQSGFSIFPNPFSEMLNITLPDSVVGNYTISITDLSGRNIYTTSQSDRNFSWNGTFLSTGIYILTVQNNGQSLVKKLIKI